MDVLKYPVYFYFGTGADQENFQSNLFFFIDDELRERIKGGDTGYHWQDLTDTPQQAIQKVNEYLGGRFLDNNVVKWHNIDPYSDSEAPTVVTYMTNSVNTLGIKLQTFKPDHGDRYQAPSQISFLNNVDVTSEKISYLWSNSHFTVETSPEGLSAVIRGSLTRNSYMSFTDTSEVHGEHNYFNVQIEIYPSDFFLTEGVNPAYETGGATSVNMYFDCVFEPGTHTISSIKEIVIYPGYSPNTKYSAYLGLSGLDLTGTQPSEDDLSNPYAQGGISGKGGGDGTLGPGGLDDIDPATIPNLPGISAADLGFITMYNPTVAQLKSLSDYMWSGAFDLVTYKKLFSDPMQSIIGLAIVPVSPSIAGSKNVKFGTLDSGVSMSYLSTNYVQVDCGSVACEKYVGCFMDNEPYTKISIYLPFIGIRQLSSDDIIGGSIHVVYNVDVLSGACACFIEHSTRGVLYSYNGSCITNVPLTAVNFSGAIQNAVSAIGSAVGMAAGMVTGAAPLTAMGVMGLMNSAANTALNSKPSVQRSGNLGGSAGILSILKPYVIIERPRLSVPNNVQKYAGQTSNITMRLSDCRGFTMCEFVHLDGITATSEEIVEIESMLKAGVIL